MATGNNLTALQSLERIVILSFYPINKHDRNCQHMFVPKTQKNVFVYSIAADLYVLKVLMKPYFTVFLQRNKDTTLTTFECAE